MLALVLRVVAVALLLLSGLYAHGWIVHLSVDDAFAALAFGLAAWCASTLDGKPAGA